MRRLFTLISTAFLFVAGALAQVAPFERASIIPPTVPISAHNGMVVAQESRAARIGAEILDRGGNAVDAAVAVAFPLAATYPRAGNLGGGGFMLIHLVKGNQDIAIDYRETAPAAATATMFLDNTGEPDPAKARDSALPVGPRPEARVRLAPCPPTTSIFFKGDEPLREGERLYQFDLADTLRAIAEKGPQGFYEGRTARQIADAVRAAGGIMSAEDLKNYRAIERPVVRGSYRGFGIVSVPPPSSGGVHLIEMLNILEGYDLAKLGRGEQSLHYLIEAMTRAYADRAVYMGDPDALKIPVLGLASKKYAARLRANINERATPSAKIRAGKPSDVEGRNTTHFSVIDRDGNAVSNTYTLNFSYGLGLVADGTGVLLNNELDDFISKPGTANAYGLIGYAANLPAPGKRPLSSMTPTIMFKDGKPFLITGSPGASRIISAVLQVIVNVIDFRMPLDKAVTAPRLHHQWQPDEVYVETGFAPGLPDALKARGHTIVPTQPFGSVNSILVTLDGYVGVADTRTRGALAAGY